MLCLINEFGCDPKDVIGDNGETLLHIACEVGNVNLVKCLIHKHKADVKARDYGNQTPIDAAAYSDKAEVVTCLIDVFGCDPNNYKGL